MYCCVGIYCPNCPLVVYVDFVNQTFRVNRIVTMACAKKVFSFHINGSAKPGKYPVQVRTIARSNMYFLFFFINLTFEKKGITRNCLLSVSLSLFLLTVLRAVAKEIRAGAQRWGSADLLHTNIIGRLGG